MLQNRILYRCFSTTKPFRLKEKIYQRKEFPLEKCEQIIGKKKIAVLGFAFKSDTNDTRETAAIQVCSDLLEEQATVTIYDPEVKEDKIKKDLGERNVSKGQLKVCSDPYEACKESHAIAILTEWTEFKALDYQRIFDSMEKPAFIFDGRNLLDISEMRAIGFQIRGIGRI